ncbi:hypothetical protein PanWU01x14_051100, partial [Parasponia andersonii]
PKPFGKVPFSLFPPRSNSLSFCDKYRESGIGPYNKLSYNISLMRFCSWPSHSGKLPLSRLLDKSKKRRLASGLLETQFCDSSRDSGKVPFKLLSDIRKNFRLQSLPTELGIPP